MFASAIARKRAAAASRGSIVVASDAPAFIAVAWCIAPNATSLVAKSRTSCSTNAARY
jgi:hypothetical protein